MNPDKYPVVLSNGQRIYQPKLLSVPPPKGSEIFVGNLPRDLFEDTLIPLFSEVGPIYRLRLMMDFSGNTRGFAFVNYYNVDDANKAILRFDKYHIKSKSRNAYITVHISLDNCRLFFGNVPRNKTTEEIGAELKRIVDGVVRVIVYAEKREPTLNRGFAFVEFESHAMAAIARRRLLAGVISLWGDTQRLYVDWAEPEPIVDPMVLTQVKILYFKNVPITWTSNRFKDFVMKIIKNIEIMRIYKKDNYAFVHFPDRARAEAALKTFKSLSQFFVFFGEQMEVEWARPCTYSKRYRINRVPDTLCTSVPPRLRKIVQRTKRENMLFSSRASSSSDSEIFSRANLASSENILAAQFEHLSLYTHF